MMAITYASVATVLLSAFPATQVDHARIVRFADRHAEGKVIEYWRLTHDPAVRDWANYHNQNCWSPDGRYVCYTHFSSFHKGAADSYDPAYKPGLEPPGVHVIDLHKRTKVAMGLGGTPRWAKQHNWLFFSRRNPKATSEPCQVCRYDCATGKTDVITTGMKHLGSTDHQDRWIFGHRSRHVAADKRWGPLARARIQPGSKLEVIYEERPAGGRPLCNPRHDLLTVRSNSSNFSSLTGFEAIRSWMDLDGSNVRMGVPRAQPCHMSWSGDGQWQLMGNHQMRGRRWDEPFPSDVHLLANISVGDISACGRSGRWICGDYEVADLRSGDGVHLPRPPANICFPVNQGDLLDKSNAHDADPKGSPDGTKISFVSNYDLKRAPFAQITANFDGATLRVTTTDGFPESGDLCVGPEVIAYKSKTSTSFEGIERHRYGTGYPRNPHRNQYVTPLTAQLMNAEEKARALPPWGLMVKALEKEGETVCCLVYQRETDVYVSVVRLPDPPHLRRTAAGAELIPGENHWETYGYFLERDGEPKEGKPLRPGQTVTLNRDGDYVAIAVEWSGLEGKPSLPVQLRSGMRLTVLREKPDDFSWTKRVWLVDGSEVDRQKARAAEAAVCEVHHLHDGVIRRERFEHGVLTEAEDLNADGEATRRLTYQNGKLMTREYWKPGQQGPISREIFGAGGFKTDEIRWRYGGQKEEYDHWYYDRGWPIKRAHREGREVYEKRGDTWHTVKRDY